MALFNRQKSQTISDLESYYANRNNSTSRAWLMALLSLLVTVAVLAALFFGVRWMYRTLTNDDTTVTTTTQPVRSNDSALEISKNTTDDNSAATSEHEGHTEGSSTDSSTSGVVTDEAASTSTPRTSSNSSATSNSTASDTSLPNTGPLDFVMITVIGLSICAGYFSARHHYASARTK